MLLKTAQQTFVQYRDRCIFNTNNVLSLGVLTFRFHRMTFQVHNMMSF